MNPGRLHSALSLCGPTPANLRTCSGISGGLPWSIRRCPRRRADEERRQRPAGIDRPMLERKLRHPDEKCSSSCPSPGLFLCLLPSAPICVTGHQHCYLSAMRAPHPCAHIALCASAVPYPPSYAPHTHTHTETSLRLEGDKKSSMSTIRM